MSDDDRSVSIWWLLAAATVSLGTLSVVVWWVGPAELWHRLSRLSAKPLLVACAGYIGAHTIRTMRVGILLPAAWSPAGLSVVASHSFANQLLPARTGELTFPALLHKYFGTSAGAGATYLLVIRFAELTALICCYAAALSIWLMTSGSLNLLETIGVSALMAVAALVAFAGSRAFLLWKIRLIESAINSELAPDWRLLDYLRGTLPDADAALDDVTSSQWRRLIAWSFGMWGAMFVVFTGCLHAAGLELGVAEIVVGAAGGILGNLLSIVGFGSLGTMEAGWTAGYVMVGAAVAPVAAAGFAVHAIVIVGSGLLAVLGAAIDYLHSSD